MSSRLLLAAMNSVRLDSLPTPGGTPSKSSLLELRYSFFSLDSLQMADWLEKTKQNPLYYGKFHMKYISFSCVSASPLQDTKATNLFLLVLLMLVNRTE